MTDHDTSQRDPMKQEWWTLPMLTAWVLWRSPEMVDWAWGAKVRDYHSGSPVTTSDVLWHFRYDEMLGNQHRSERNMKREDIAESHMGATLNAIADALENDRIRGMGRSPYDERARPIIAMEWIKADVASLTVASSGQLADAIYAAGTDKAMLLAVRVMREDVMREPWPDFGPARSKHAVEASKPAVPDGAPIALEVATVEQPDVLEANAMAVDAPVEPTQIVQSRKASRTELHNFMQSIEEKDLSRDEVDERQRDHFGERFRGTKSVYEAYAKGSYRFPRPPGYRNFR